MNKIGFMSQLESLLAEIPAAEREEALQYYNDYFEDAGPENESSVIASLGSPRDIAENIKAELKGEVIPTSAKAGEHAIAKYGQIVPVSEVRDEGEKKTDDAQGRGGAGGAGGRGGFGGAGGAGGRGGFGGAGGAGGQSGFGGAGGAIAAAATWKDSMPNWVWILVLIGLICLVPAVFGLLAGIAGGIFGLAVAWFSIILACGVTALSLFVAGIVVTVVSFLCLPVNLIVFVTVLGVGLLSISFALLFLMLTVWMGGKATPAILKGFGWFWRFCWNGLKKLINNIA